ncbi:PREDICTED: uncharacterized protein LOC109353813 [Lupinus angustifolius]|uniref:uncharacterized protein LOC109353813 n=1 Tax=Lupinus angustifolius TaxID=3871 RepID=UPI00092E8262|nr:PREDICTED: uncharacterized protein LOC109353813 [Lupinus angustifolius]
MHQCLDGANYEKINGAETAKQAWESLEKSYEGVAKIKKVKLHKLRRQYELLQMEDSDSVAEYMTKILSLSNQMRSCGKVMKEKIAIEESKNLEELKIEELQASLESHELRLKEKNPERTGDQALQARFTKKSHGQWSKKCNEKTLNSKWRASEQGISGRKTNVQWSDIREEEAGLAHNDQESDAEHCLLMATTRKDQDNEENVEFWYLDTGCSNHMSGMRDWFATLKESTKSRVNFADQSSITAEGVGKVMIQI